MKIKKEIQKNVIRDYFNGNLKVFEIAKKYNLCRQSIRNIILYNNLYLKEYNTPYKIVSKVIKDYQNNLTNKEIAKKYQLHRSVVQQILIRNNVKLKSLAETARKYFFINENYFNVIDTQEKAYILGLLYADGYINKNGFGISLIETDKNILEEISNILYGKIALGYKKARTYGKNSKYVCKPQYRLEVTSKIMKNDLIKHGCVERKTFKIRLPKLNDNLYKHFIRGYFDGDGSICIPSKRPRNVTVTITSNKVFCDDIANYIHDTININMKSIVRYGDIGMNRLTGRKQILKFKNWLYKDATIFLKRKHEKFKLI